MVSTASVPLKAFPACFPRTTLGQVWVRRVFSLHFSRTVSQRHVPLGGLLLPGDLLAGLHVVPSLALLETGVGLQPVLHVAVHSDALAAVGLAGGEAAHGADRPAAHLVGEEAAARADEAEAGQAAGPAAGRAAGQAALTFPLQSAGCGGPGWPAGSCVGWCGCRPPGGRVFCSP